MTRNIRHFDHDGYFHATHRGNNRSPVFLDGQDYRVFVNKLEQVVGKYGFDLFHFCLMPNHIHFLLRAGDGAVSLAMQSLFGCYAKYFCKKYKRSGHVWKERFDDKPIESDTHLFASGHYIEMNPVRAGIVRRPSDWPYSSYRRYVGLEAFGFISPDFFYSTLGNSQDDRARMYQKMMR